MSYIEKYTIDTLKLLIVFPGIDPDQCLNVDFHLASLVKPTVSSVMESRAILPWLQKPQMFDQEVVSAMQLDRSLITHKPKANKVDICSSEEELDSLPTFALPPHPVQPPVGPPRGVKRARVDAADSDTDDVQVVSSATSWPEGVTMAQMNQFWHPLLVLS
ncbi:uncharacterized protein MELLADRAFT_102745 [Melampsora larici-populina 98AG31]|uniref:Uncharacterized protein n=1 Tax=Melampsora larici-populina (strain 98AG31 / pathotype 3-4-7) TaxID=747676 RepID=F4R990_MELLP|nr:uncharacterized protein MELLADRAFT_102745 [Melampsora larici-populina 98AG31]EGG10942.1 hypothetical protein MELLADRAFT_102745 [Melampsora larici-populina 98AG31]